MPFPSKSLTGAQLLTWLNHPFTNFTAVADAFYDGKSARPYDALQRRLTASDKISKKTLTRLNEVYDQFNQDISN
jgi:hypothetical protein